MSTSSQPTGRASWLSDEEPPRRNPVRFVAGVAVGVVALLVLIAFVLGAVNPWRLVVLEAYVGNPLLGATIFFAMSLAAAWLLTPVSNEAAQGSRLWVRLGLAALLLVSLAGYAVAGELFGGEYRVVAESSDKSRRLVMRVQGEDRELRIWAGKGLGARDAGRLGLACGDVVGSFSGNDQVQVASVYGDFDLRLDPDTGAPIDTIGPTCSG